LILAILYFVVGGIEAFTIVVAVVVSYIHSVLDEGADVVSAFSKASLSLESSSSLLH